MNVPITKKQVESLKMGFTPTPTFVRTDEDGNGWFYPNRRERRKMLNKKKKGMK